MMNPTQITSSAQVAAPEQQRQITTIELARQDPRLDDELEIDSDPKVSEGDDNGAWVAAWLWVDFSGTPLDKDVEECK